MTTFISFLPPLNTAFQSLVTLDNITYNLNIRWNIYGRRWYVTINNQDESRVVTLPLIGSPNDSDINILQGYFNSTFVFRQASQMIEVNP